MDELSNYLRNEVATFLVQNTVSTLPIFANKDPLILSQIVTRLKPLSVMATEYLMRCDEIGREMFILLSGEVEVETGDGVYIATLTEGTYFGEAAALNLQQVVHLSLFTSILCC